MADAIAIFVRHPDMAFPVVDAKGRVIGEVNQHDVLKLALPLSGARSQRVMGPEGIRSAIQPAGKKVVDIMRTNHVKVKANTTIMQAASIMLDTEVRTLEVVDEKGKPLGFISELDILRYLKKKLENKK